MATKNNNKNIPEGEVVDEKKTQSAKSSERAYENFSVFRLFFGLSIVTVGALLLLQNYGVVDLSGFELNFANLWPIVIILIGLSMLSFKTVAARVVGAIITLLIFIAVFAFALTPNNLPISGTGEKVVKEEANPGKIDEIEMSTLGTLTIVQGDKESYKIEGEDRVVSLLNVSVNNGKLDIKSKNDWPYVMRLGMMNTRGVDVTVTVKDLEKINVSGANKVASSELKVDSLEIDASGATELDMKVEAKTLDFDISGAGKFDIDGITESQKVKISGAGEYDASELKSKTAKVDVSGVGKAKLDVTENLDVEISGGGDVEYTGGAKVTQDISGAGKVREKK